MGQLGQLNLLANVVCIISNVLQQIELLCHIQYAHEFTRLRCVSSKIDVTL